MAEHKCEGWNCVTCGTHHACGKPAVWRWRAAAWPQSAQPWHYTCGRHVKLASYYIRERLTKESKT